MPSSLLPLHRHQRHRGCRGCVSGNILSTGDGVSYIPPPKKKFAHLLKLNSTKIKLHTNHTGNCQVPTCKVKVPRPYTDLFYLFNVNTSHQMRSQSSQIVRRDVIQCLCFVIWLLNCKMSYTPPLKRYRQTALHFMIKKSDENPE
jgi:hypothetical protein